MKAIINQQLIAQTTLDSGALTMLGAVIHNFPEPGEYHGAVLNGKQLAATFRLTVEEQSPATQVNIDLAALTGPLSDRPSSECECQVERREGEPESAPHFVVNPRGHALFYVSQGKGGFAVKVNRVNEQRILFDSRELQDGDLFAATLIRPGLYSVTNVPTRSRGEVVVGYPKMGKTAFSPSEPATIEAANKGLFVVAGGKDAKLDKLRLEPAQGQLYRIRVPSRIKIELTKPDDGPKDKQPPGLLAWRRQAGPRKTLAGPRDRRASHSEHPRTLRGARSKSPVKTKPTKRT